MIVESSYGDGTQAPGRCLETYVLSSMPNFHMDISDASVSVLPRCPFVHGREDKGRGSIFNTLLTQRSTSQFNSDIWPLDR